MQSATGEPASPGVRPSLTRTVLALEVLLVLGVSLGRSAVYSLIDFVAALTAPQSLKSQSAVLNGSLAPDRPWLDLTLQLVGIGFRLVPVALVGYLLWRTGDSVRTRLVGRGRHGRDVVRGCVLALGVGSIGVGFYVLTHELGINLTVVAEDLPDVWWRYPLLILSALQNALLEEFVVLGYLLVRLEQMGFSRNRGIAISALVRGSYHLYQGVGGFVANTVMGALFGWLYTRWGRVTPLVITHTLLDVGAFVGYALLASHVSWL